MHFTGAAQRLAEAIRFKTVSHPAGEGTDFGEFDAFIAWAESAWPKVFATLQFERINGYAMLLRWKGETDLPGNLYMAHYDVVPASIEDGWQEEPFAGIIKDGLIWGRGSLDCKQNLVSRFEALDRLIAEGYQPQRDIWLAFGHDEEVGGDEGAAAICQALLKRGLTIRAVFDEGPGIGNGAKYGVDTRVASVAVAEKGSSNLEIRVAGALGHSAMPPAHTAIGQMSRLITAIEEKPRAPRLTDLVAEEFGRLAPYMKENQEVFADLTANWGEALPLMEADPYLAAHLRSTVSFTMMNAGTAPNVLPKEAVAVANIRILPGESSAEVLDHLKTFADFADFEFRFTQISEPSEVSSSESPEWHLLEGLIKESFGEVLVLPALALGGSDAKHFSPLTPNVYRFTGIESRPGEQGKIHAVDEFISVKLLQELCEFDYQLMRRFD